MIIHFWDSNPPLQAKDRVDEALHDDIGDVLLNRFTTDKFMLQYRTGGTTTETSFKHSHVSRRQLSMSKLIPIIVFFYLDAAYVLLTKTIGVLQLVIPLILRLWIL